MSLRPYQERLITEVRAAYASGKRAVVMQLGTGGGKTHTASAVLDLVLRKGHRAIFCAHLDSLIEDTHARLTEAGIRAGFVQAGRPSDPEARIQVCSFGTMHSRRARPEADVVVIDECHRAPGNTIRKILADYPEAHLLGLTATPQRGDGKPLGDVFDALVKGPTVKELTQMGSLVPSELLDMGGGGRALGMCPVKAWQTYTPNRRAMVFAETVDHALELTRAFNAAGIAAGALLGPTPRRERRALRARLAEGELKVLVGVGVFIEGFHCPPVEAIVLARGFSVTGGFLQAIGRGLRPCDGKERCTVLDLKSSWLHHGLPDEDRDWNLEGRATRQTESLAALMRCSECLAVFRPQRECPRCGATRQHVQRFPRVLSRAERAERINDLPPEVRDARVIDSLLWVARTQIGLSEKAAQHFALRRFRARFGRAPFEREGEARP